VRFHDLRHTCATLLLSRAVHPKFVLRVIRARFHSHDPGPLLSLDALDGGPDGACNGGRPKLTKDASLVALLPTGPVLGAWSLLFSVSKGIPLGR